MVLTFADKVNRVGELKLALEERERALARVQSELEAVRREADAERTAQEERARFEAHRPSRYSKTGIVLTCLFWFF